MAIVSQMVKVTESMNSFQFKEIIMAALQTTSEYSIRKTSDLSFISSEVHPPTVSVGFNDSSWGRSHSVIKLVNSATVSVETAVSDFRENDIRCAVEICRSICFSIEKAVEEKMKEQEKPDCAG